MVDLRKLTRIFLKLILHVLDDLRVMRLLRLRNLLIGKPNRLERINTGVFDEQCQDGGRYPCRQCESKVPILLIDYERDTSNCTNDTEYDCNQARKTHDQPNKLRN